VGVKKRKEDERSQPVKDSLLPRVREVVRLIAW